MADQRLAVQKSSVFVSSSPTRRRVELGINDGNYVDITLDPDEVREVIKMLRQALEELNNG